MNDSPMTARTIGEVAFLTYRSTRVLGPDEQQTMKMPSWEEIPENVRESWEAAANSVIRALHPSIALLDTRSKLQIVYQQSREVSLAITKIEEAELWLTRAKPVPMSDAASETEQRRPAV